MNHLLSKTIQISTLIELISKKYNLSIDEARDELYKSKFIDLIHDDKTGLYGDSPLFLLSMYDKYHHLYK